MTAEQRERAFDRFWRASTTRSQLGGSGLGLAIVQKLAEAEGGRAELRAPPTAAASTPASCCTADAPRVGATVPVGPRS